MRMTIVTRFAAVCVFQILKKEKLEIGLGGPSLALLKIPSLSLSELSGCGCGTCTDILKARQ